MAQVTGRVETTTVLYEDPDMRICMVPSSGGIFMMKKETGIMVSITSSRDEIRISALSGLPTIQTNDGSPTFVVRSRG